MVIASVVDQWGFEFYPTCPTSSLQLSWASIFEPVNIPADLTDKFVTIPYSILYERLLPFTLANDLPTEWNPSRTFSYDDVVTGLVPSSDPSEPVSEALLPDPRVEDLDFSGRVEPKPLTPMRALRAR
ncbi:hypothetical protein Q9L58_008334 [Maublancomyces gigas]|uniref:Uncharacterized protein n=1 Tax=Discina gigas TaxID=1032678 RepID=A0ABR3G9Z8_9PEZI